MTELRFDGLVAIVTGAGRGIGRSHALLLAERGARVVVNDVGGSVDGSGADVEPARSVVDEIDSLGGHAVASLESVTTPEGAANTVALGLERFGRVDILVNNAGILTTTAFPDTSDDDLERHLAVHLKGAFFMSRAVWPQLVAGGQGRIVSTTSASFLGMHPVISYATAKSGLIGLTRSLATIGRDLGIKANLVAPLANTRMSGRTKRGKGNQADRSAPRGPELVSPAVVALVHESCPLNGEILGVGMGRVARMFLAETVGYVNPALTPEDVVEHWSQIVDHSDFFVPEEYADYSATFRELATQAGDG